MKTLVESLFGDNITNNVNVTTVEDAEKVVFNEVFRHLYAKQTTKGQTSRKHDNLAAHELSRVFNIIVK